MIEKFETETLCPLTVLPVFEILPLGANPARLDEWRKFLNYLATYRKVAYVNISGWELLINPPDLALVSSKQKVVVSYRRRSVSMPGSLYAPTEPRESIMRTGTFYAPIDRKDCMIRSGNQYVPTEPRETAICTVSPNAPVAAPGMYERKRSSFAQTHPSYLETLGQSHASWLFGALAELIDNARDAQASRLDISIDEEFLESAEANVPVLSVKDNGTGMTHSDIMRMVSFGHGKPDKDDESLIGRFGVGFKTGAMRIGKDAVVFTQTAESRTIAFLSRSFNEDKEEVDIPVITYRCKGKWMDFDLEVHTRGEAESRLQAVKQFSPFNEYSIGSKFAAFGNQPGTVICIYNLDRWGSNYSLEWETIDSEQKRKRDIWIRSRRVRMRMAQMTTKVPLDYSLHSYLEVMFLEPRMKIYVQGTLVKTRRLHKSLSNTRVFKGMLMGKKVELTLGFNQAERENGNCGIFLYWHGRLIEAYRRVGAMLHTADVGRGVIGVIDVTDIMRLGDGGVGVLNNKQGFQDIEEYVKLIEWLGTQADQYWDEHYDRLLVGKKDENAVYTPDFSWVQCNRCLKWRMLEAGANEKDLPDDWFCYMPPFRGSCMQPESEMEPGVVTVAATRNYGGANGGSNEKDEMEMSTTACNSTLSSKEQSDASLESDDNAKSKQIKPPILRRLKRGPVQVSKSRQQQPMKKLCRSG
ncbi:hypothetical protein KP509_10G001700 [Ceratopteris richardii]|nr:hypothetical protein KP509_10G001700 [Ceratopteris richardii]